MDSNIDEQALADLCPEIRALLDAELAAGGSIRRVDRYPNYGENVIAVDLNHNFSSIDKATVPDGVSFHGKDMQVGIGDHFYCTKHDHSIVAPFR